jgi:hypothetical protein
MPDFVDVIGQQVLATLEGSPLANELRGVSRLHSLCAGLQTQPAELAQPLLEATRSMIELIPQLGGAVPRNDDGPSAGQLMILSYLALIQELLRDDWEGVYRKILPAYPALDEDLSRLRSIVAAVSFEQALARLDEGWSPGADELLDLAAILFIRSAALVEVSGSRDLYTRVAKSLDHRQPFLKVYVAAACLMMPALKEHIDLENWNAEQYDCVALLDNFHFLSGAEQWG